MRALVTGCAGFIGSHLTDTLLEAGHSVVGVDCFNDNYGRAQKEGNLARARDWNSFELLTFDLSQGNLAAVVSNCDTVYHLAAEPGVRSSWGNRFQRYAQNNLIATQCLLEALRSSPQTRMVYASSSSVYGQVESLPTREDVTPRPLSPYGVTKLGAEHLCHLYFENHGLHTVSLRYFTAFGPRQRPDMAFNIFCRAALMGAPITVYGDGSQTRDFTYVDDITAATLAAGTLSTVELGQTYNVGGGLRTSVREVLDTIAELADRTLDIRNVAWEHGDVRDTGADTTRARRDLAFEPRVRLEEGLRAELDWINALPSAREMELAL
ncbi:MAG TPA: GDP-mannose 4,6-dehydratase [Solirubrobacteraceae bacterium]|jgi:UDP-glucuronate 4-epimerase|nr:GDP-mannose 4,6-dehydratase [Solirubrobacteraceae bacterium]